MEIKNKKYKAIEFCELIAAEGKILKHIESGSLSKDIILAKNDSPNNYIEIDEE